MVVVLLIVEDKVVSVHEPQLALMKQRPMDSVHFNSVHRPTDSEEEGDGGGEGGREAGRGGGGRHEGVRDD